MIIENKTLTEVIDNGYRDFAIYTLEARAIPSVVDGLKPVTRKLLYAMINEHGGKRVKVADLGGISKHNYHHGEKAAIDAALGMAAKWCNTAPLFEGHGNFGSRMVQEASGPRYIHASLSENFKKIFHDTEVAPAAFDTENPEPAYYLPIIPWVLVNGVGGMAVGFKVEVLPRALVDVINATKAYLKNPKRFLEANEVIKPTFPNFSGEIIQKGDNQWVTRGLIKFIGKNTFEISELPVGYDRETYVTLLNEMIEKDLIKDYDDECSKTGFGFKVKVSILQKLVIDKNPIKYFKLEKTHTELLTTMGVDGKLKIFTSVAELVGYFCDFRTLKFGHKIDYDKKKIYDEILLLSDKQKFIFEVINGSIDFKTTTKADLLQFIVDNITGAEHGKAFVRIPLYEITNDAWLELGQSIKDLQNKLAVLDSVTPEKLYQTRLTALKV